MFREYAYAEHYTFAAWDATSIVVTTVITAVVVGYLFLGKHALVGAFVATVSTRAGSLAGTLKIRQPNVKK